MSRQDWLSGALPAAPNDVRSIETIVAAFYEAISFPPHGYPDWERTRSLFVPDGRVIPPRTEQSGALVVMNVERFAEWSNQLAYATGLRASGFHEKELVNITERFGDIAHVFSTYESRFTALDYEPFERGINSIQLAWDGARWWIVTVLWDVASAQKPIPAKYLRGSAS